jgi:hypothetical protein
LRRKPAQHIQHAHHFGDHTIKDWGMFCREAKLVYLEGCSEKIGDPKKTIEIDDSKFDRRKYHRGHPVKEQWVFGGDEPESGRTSLALVPDRTADTLVNVIRAWIEPDTTVISDCWAAYRDIESIGYTRRTVSHSVSFVNPDTGDHTNTIEAMWRAVEDFLGPYNRRENYHYHLAHYMFAARRKATGVPLFNQLINTRHNNNLYVPAPNDLSHDKNKFQIALKKSS